MNNIDYLLWLARPDLQATFDLDNTEHSQRLREWVVTEGAKNKAIRVWLEALNP